MILVEIVGRVPVAMLTDCDNDSIEMNVHDAATNDSATTMTQKRHCYFQLLGNYMREWLDCYDTTTNEA
jgi:hypothetical protein